MNLPGARHHAMTLAANRRANAVLGALFFSLFPMSAHADEVPFAQRDIYGEVGLLDMPSARMAPDGQLAITTAARSDIQRVVFSAQILPWLEGSFRYTRINYGASNGLYYDRSFGFKVRLFTEGEYMPDVSLGARDIVGTGIYGSEFLAFSKTVYDFDVTAGLGWGRLASNGTFPNPFGLAINSFKTRSIQSTLNQSGTFTLGQFFHGPDVGVFGGVVWHTPIENLNLTAEYSSDRYLYEASQGGIRVKSPINIGLSYMPLEGISLMGGWFYGTTFGAMATVSIDPTHTAAPVKIGANPLLPVLRPIDEQADAVAALVEGPNRAPQIFTTAEINAPVQSLPRKLAEASNIEIYGRTLLVDIHASKAHGDYCAQYAQAAATRSGIDSVAVTDLDSSKVALCKVTHDSDASQMTQIAAYTEESGDAAEESSADPVDKKAVERQIRSDAAAQALKIEAVSIGASELVVYYRNTHYEFETAAIGRLVRVLMQDAPPGIEIFRLVAVQYGEPVQDIQILRAPLERMFATHGTTADIRQAISLRHPPLSNPVLDAGQSGTYPRFYWAISPSVRQGLFDPNAPVRVQLLAVLSGGLEILPGLSLDATYEANIYNTFTRTPAVSDLPHVRSAISEYLTKGANGVSVFDMTYRTRISPGLFVEAKAGYLEDMFAGAGGQILWRPQGQRWALGADIYEVWQRNFDRLAGLQHYHVLTGHVSLYYQSPWNGININLHAGRYLAGDNGLTIEVARRFSTGIEVGAFATFTNVPFSQFGEGSFDKGITLSIPLEWALPFSTQSSYNLTLRPLTRDGGQRLYGDDSLYDETRRTSYEEISQSVEYIAQP